jgi:hypothetical protein
MPLSASDPRFMASIVWRFMLADSSAFICDGVTDGQCTTERQKIEVSKLRRGSSREVMAGKDLGLERHARAGDPVELRLVRLLVSKCGESGCVIDRVGRARGGDET